jgi:hypothetical protein
MKTLDEYKNENEADKYLKSSLFKISQEEFNQLNNESVLTMMKFIATSSQYESKEKYGISDLKFIKDQDELFLVIESTPSYLLKHEIYQENKL